MPNQTTPPVLPADGSGFNFIPPDPSIRCFACRRQLAGGHDVDCPAIAAPIVRARIDAAPDDVSARVLNTLAEVGAGAGVVITDGEWRRSPDVNDPVLQREDDGSPTHIAISAATFDEIRETLERAGYAFFVDTIECEGMTLVRRQP